MTWRGTLCIIIVSECAMRTRSRPGLKSPESLFDVAVVVVGAAAVLVVSKLQGESKEDYTGDDSVVQRRRRRMNTKQGTKRNNSYQLFITHEINLFVVIIKGKISQINSPPSECSDLISEGDVS